MSDSTPASGSFQSVNVTSNRPNTAVVVVLDYRGPNTTLSGTTNASGSVSVFFIVKSGSNGFTVNVSVTVGGAACTTSFTPH